MRKLDKRIQKVTDIKTPFSEDFEELSNYIGFNAYGADDANCFHDLDVCFFGALKRVNNESYDSLNFSFTIDNGKPEEGAMPFRYMILEKDLESKEKKEKKYRPFTLEEFQQFFTIGQPIKFRRKAYRKLTHNVMFIGYREDDMGLIVLLGNAAYSLKELFEEYEYFFENGKTWVLFGVEVEE